MNQPGWMLKGNFYECCRTEGQCPLWFGRDLWGKSCVNFATYQITGGHINGVDMKGIIIIHHQDGLGPTYAELRKGAQEGAVYISDNATDEQKQLLEAFAIKNLGADKWKKRLGVKFVNVKISKENNTYHIVMPYGEQHLTMTTGGDGETAVRMENPRNKAYSNIQICNTDLWSFHDYGKNIEFRNTSGVVTDFAVQGD